MKEIIKKPQAPVYHRQRAMLFFLEAAKTGLGKLDFQKLLFLFNQELEKPHHSFVPYTYGCYSFQCADDIDLLEKRGWIQNDGNQLLLTFENLNNEPWAKNNKERSVIKKWLTENNLRGDALVAETYRRYPYYAIHSQMKARLLSDAEIKAVLESVTPINDSKEIVFTLGYEGLHFETYLNRLIQNHINGVCDVRKNPNSRKFGFSSHMLGKILPKFGIEYVHIPALGIESERRKKLNRRQDYMALFNEYRKRLPYEKEDLAQLEQLIRSKRRIALTCFEADPLCCHRHCVAELMATQKGCRVTHL